MYRGTRYYTPCVHYESKETYESLKKKLDDAKKDYNYVANLKISDETKEPVLKELQEKIDAIKKRMHDFIDRL